MKGKSERAPGGGKANLERAGMQAHGGGADADFIDPDLLEEKCKDCECALCLGVMVKPVSGCPQGHSFCHACFAKALTQDKRCPTCRAYVQGENTLVPNRQLEGVLANLRLRCEHAPKEQADAPTAKRAKPAPAAFITLTALRQELGKRGLETTGSKPELVARLEEDRRKGAGCGWRGRVGELAVHLLVTCEWVPVKCTNAGCPESPLRKDLAQHDATCGNRVVKCSHCWRHTLRHSLAEHEQRCPRAMIECPNEGCTEQHKWDAMNLHRAECEHEEPKP